MLEGHKFERSVFITSLIAGGLAGTSVDTILYPIDTLKTRLQSQQGFRIAGGFSHLYKGIAPVLIGSAPTAALFFVSYETIKIKMQDRIPQKYHTFLHMGAASLAEVVACLIRVPVEIVKQRRQALLVDKGKVGIRLLYRGFKTTVTRDMAFSLLQFPLWEHFKKIYSLYVQRDIYPVESACCGAIAGGISAAATTPLDVMKTRIMLGNIASCSSEFQLFCILFQQQYKKDGIRGLFVGIGPRVTWITFGGFIFFGVYEEAKLIVTKIFQSVLTTL